MVPSREREHVPGRQAYAHCGRLLKHIRVLQRGRSSERVVAFCMFRHYRRVRAVSGVAIWRILSLEPPADPASNACASAFSMSAALRS
jgi:hypothetical protein